MTCWLWLLLTPVLTAAEPTVAYSKFFKGSTPEFVSITVEKDGHVTFKEAKDDPAPITFQMEPGAAEQVFSLAIKLDRFKRPLESGLKVAHMGIKMFRFTEGAEATEVKFNYTTDADAQALNDWFERITETEENWIDLDRAVHFDKLGVNQALLELQTTWERKRLVAPQQFLPLLARIAKNESFLHMARERAASLTDAFQRPSTKASSP